MNAPKYLQCFNRQAALELLPGLIVLALTTFGALVFPKGTQMRALLSGVGGVAICYVVLVSVASIRRLDELQQRIHFIAITAAFTVTGMIVTSWELFAKAGIPVPEPGLWLWFVMVGVWMLGLVVVGRRYQ